MRRTAARVDDPLGDSLMVEVRDFFAQDEILEQHRPALERPQRILVVRDRQSLVGRQYGALVGRELMHIAAWRHGLHATEALRSGSRAG